MQINGVGNSQSGDVRYRNNRTQYQSASDKTTDNEESVILTLSSKAMEEAQKAATVTNVKPKEEAVSSDWLQQFIQRVKAFLVNMWNGESEKVSESPREVSEEIVINKEHLVEDNQLEELSEAGIRLENNLMETEAHAQTEQIQSDTQREEVLQQIMDIQGEEKLQEPDDAQQEEKTFAQENAHQGTFGELLRPFLDVIKRFLANPFSDEPLVPKKQESPREQQKQTDFAEYAAKNGWDDQNIAHQMQVKSQLGDTYNRRGEHTQMTKEVPSNLSFKS